MDNVLQNPNLGRPGSSDLANSFSLVETVDLVRGFFRRQYPMVLFCLACGIGLGLIRAYTAPASYTAHTMLMIDSGKVRVLQQQQSLLGELPLDTVQVDTQVEVIKSEGIALSVIKELKLTDDPEFVGTQSGLFGALYELALQPFFPAAPASQIGASENELTRRAVGRFQSARDVKRVMRTYVLDISFRSSSPGRAAQIANAIADAYILDQLDAKYQATKRASTWLQDRIIELRQQAITADRAVLEYKENNNIVSMGGGDGRLLSEQAVVDLNSQLSGARAAVSEAKARLDRIQEIMKQDRPDAYSTVVDDRATVTDQLRNDIINRLRTQWLELDRRYNIWISRYGGTHLAAVNLKTQMDELRRSMLDELGRIAESYKSDYEISKARLQSLEESLAKLISGAQLTNRGRLGLAELESRARAYHSIHDSFLQRYMEATQQQSVPITESRVITSAAGGGRSDTGMAKILMVAGSLGLLFGFGAAMLREAVDRVFRTTRQVETILKTNCLAALPVLKSVESRLSAAKSARIALTDEPGRSAKRVDPDLPRIFRQVLNEPLSAFAEGFRAIKVAVDISATIKENKVIGITSSLPNEGKSTAACNFAELIANSGARVILVDGDLRNPTLSHQLTPKADMGVLEVLSNRVEVHDAIHIDEMSGLAFLPAVIESRLAHSSDILASEAFKQLIDKLRKSYDYVIVDFPPLAPVVDVRATTKIVDSYVFVVEWGRTRINLVQHQLATAPEVYDRLLGVVLNKANTRILERYEDYYGRYYYHKKRYYSRYGYYTH